MNPNSYGTPRTTPVGQVQHVVAAEYISYRHVGPALVQSPSTFQPVPGKQVDVDNTPAAPTYIMRIGLSERTDLGIRLGNFSALGTDLKWNFLKTPGLDLALDPGIGAFRSFSGGDGGFGHLHGDLPLLLGLNPSSSFTIAPSVGLAYGFNTSSIGYADGIEAASGTEGALLHAGIGLDFRTSPTFALHPEMSILRPLAGPAGTDLIWYTFGVGFVGGTLPDYGMSSEE